MKGHSALKRSIFPKGCAPWMRRNCLEQCPLKEKSVNSARLLGLKWTKGRVLGSTRSVLGSTRTKRVVMRLLEGAVPNLGEDRILSETEAEGLKWCSRRNSSDEMSSHRAPKAHRSWASSQNVALFMWRQAALVNGDSGAVGQEVWWNSRISRLWDAHVNPVPRDPELSTTLNHRPLSRPEMPLPPLARVLSLSWFWCHTNLGRWLHHA